NLCRVASESPTKRANCLILSRSGSASVAAVIGSPPRSVLVVNEQLYAPASTSKCELMEHDGTAQFRFFRHDLRGGMGVSSGCSSTYLPAIFRIFLTVPTGGQSDLRATWAPISFQEVPFNARS